MDTLPATRKILHPPAQCCAFTGHRTLSMDSQKQVCALLRQLVPTLLSRGIDTFYFGGALGFDTVAAECLHGLRDRDRLPIRTVIAVPCRDQDSRWNAAQVQRYRRMLADANHVVILSESHYAGCMLERNQYMVDRANTLIAFYQPGRRGGTEYTVHYARRLGRRIINLYGYCNRQ